MLKPKLNAETLDEKANSLSWLKRLGVLGFWFFFLKGIVWLVAFGSLGYLGVNL